MNLGVSVCWRKATYLQFTARLEFKSMSLQRSCQFSLTLACKTNTKNRRYRPRLDHAHSFFETNVIQVMLNFKMDNNDVIPLTILKEYISSDIETDNALHHHANDQCVQVACLCLSQYFPTTRLLPPPQQSRIYKTLLTYGVCAVILSLRVTARFTFWWGGECAGHVVLWLWRLFAAVVGLVGLVDQWWLLKKSG
jgi:hypothetical protein